MSFYFTLILVTHKFVCCLLQFSSCCFNSDHGYWYSLHNLTNFGDLSSQNDFFATLAINFSHHNSLDVKKNTLKSYLTLGMWRSKWLHEMLIKLQHMNTKITWSKNEVLAYSVNTKCFFQFDEPLWKGLLPIKVDFSIRKM